MTGIRRKRTFDLNTLMTIGTIHYCTGNLHIVPINHYFYSSIAMITDSALRLSAMRAFLGLIFPEMRLIAVTCVNHVIELHVICTQEPSDSIREAISIAATEIIADFPDAIRIDEIIEVSKSAIAAQNILEEGWIFKRAE